MIDLKPKPYNINQDFLSMKHRKRVAKEFNETTEVKQEKHNA